MKLDLVGLRARLLGLVIVPALLVGVFVVVGGIYLLERHASDHLERLTQRTAFGALSIIHSISEQMGAEVGSYAQFPAMRDGSEDASSLVRRMSGLLDERHSGVSEIVFFDTKGHVLAGFVRGPGLGSAPVPFESLPLQADGGRRGVIARAPGGPLELLAAAPVLDETGELRGYLGLGRVLDNGFAKEVSERLNAEIAFLTAMGLVGASNPPLLAGISPDWWRQAQAMSDEATPEPLQLDGQRYSVLVREFLSADQRPHGRVVVLARSEGWQLALSQAVELLIGLCLLVLVTALVIAVVIGTRMIRPLAAMTDTLRAMADGQGAGELPVLPKRSSPELRNLSRAVESFKRATEERAALARQLNFLASHDALTDLPNRVLFQDRLEQALAMAQREGQGLALLVLDITHFQEVNEVHGHEIGDQLLRQMAQRLSDALRQSDTLARLGGDEFAIIAPRTSHGEAVEALAERLLAVTVPPFILAGREIQVSVFIGAALSDVLGTTTSATLLREADAALRQAKIEGQGKLHFYDPALNKRLVERRALERDLRETVESGGFTLVFQPQVATEDRRLLGAEALLRWRHPQQGMIPPDLFIPLAEETGLIAPIGEWVLREACRTASGWPDLSIAVNVSATQLRDSQFVGVVESVLAETGLPASRLELEITEGVMLEHSSDTIGTLNRLRRLGVRLAMDDFGTGYSSLANLRRLPIEKMKLDRSFVRHALEDPSAAALVRAVMSIGQALGITTNAEGVEEEAQFEFLRSLGCHEVQGFLISRPLPADEFQAAFLPDLS